MSYSRTLFCFIYSTVYILIPNFLIYPSPSFPFWYRKFVFYACESASTLSVSSFASFFLDSTYKCYHVIFIWLHLVWSSLVASMLLQMALFHSFFWLSNIPLSMYYAFFIHCPTHGHLGCSHVLAFIHWYTFIWYTLVYIYNERKC